MRDSPFLSVAVLFGVAVVIVTEALSIGQHLTIGPLAVTWLALLAVSGGALAHTRRGSRAAVAAGGIGSRRPWGWHVPVIVCICLLVGVVAVLAPPNNYDSMTYHMGRVAHWVQEGSVAHYPTAILRQLYQPPFTEYVILHLQVLSGGDRLANLVQWMAFLGTIAGVAVVARQLGADRHAQLFAAIFAATLPMAILQGSSTQNDLVASFWLVSLASFVLRLSKKPTLVLALAVGASLGLALLTKGTAYLFAFPIMICALISGWRTQQVRGLLKIALASSVAIVLNLGFYVRNTELFGTPLASGRESYFVSQPTPRSLVSNLLRNTVMHLGTPVSLANRALKKAVQLAHEAIGIDPEDPTTTFGRQNFKVRFRRHEDHAGNPLHLLLIGASVGLVISKKVSRAVLVFGLIPLAGLLLFCLLLRWQPWHTRLQLPLFLLSAPPIACVLASGLRARVRQVLLGVLVAGAIPFVLANETRPLVGGRATWRVTRISQYFRNASALESPYIAAAQILAQPGVRHIGLVMTEDDWEYPLWPLLQARRKELPVVEHVAVDNVSERIRAGATPDVVLAFHREGDGTLLIRGLVFHRLWASAGLAVFGPS